MYDNWFQTSERSRVNVFKNNVHESNKFLSDNEEKVLIQICNLLSACGMGLAEAKLFDIISSIVCEREDERNRVDPIYDVV